MMMRAGRIDDAREQLLNAMREPELLVRLLLLFITLHWRDENK